MSDEADRDLFGPIPAAPRPEDIMEEPERWESAMAELADFAIAELIETGVDAAHARRLGCAVVIRLCREVGGCRYYWSKGLSLDRAARDLRIYAAHDGTVEGPRGVRALAREHGMTDIHIWRILRRQRDLHRRLAGL